MALYNRITLNESGAVTVVQFNDKKIIDPAIIDELGDELFALIERDQRKAIVLNFGNVEFLSSATINNLIKLDRKARAAKGSVRFSNLRRDIREVINILRLDKLFAIHAEEAEAVAAFG
ncbi:MAG: STAS domain-containing protein [Pirellulales bacterium]